MLDSASFFQALRRLLRPSPASKPAGPSPQSPTRPLQTSLLGSRAFFFRMRSCDPTPRCPNETSGPMGSGSRVRLALVHWSKENMDRPFSLQNNTLLQIKSQMVTSTKNPSTLRQGCLATCPRSQGITRLWPSPPTSPSATLFPRPHGSPTPRRRRVCVARGGRGTDRWRVTAPHDRSAGQSV